jgi:hypothetical protein
MKSNTAHGTYADKWLRIVAYPVLATVIRHFGDMAPLGDLLKRPLYYADLLWNLLIVVCSWEANRALIIYLDRHHPWEKDKLRRFLIQVSTAFPMTFLIVIPMIYLWNEVLIDRGGFDTANLLVNDFPLTVIFTGMVHMLYTFWYYRNHYLGIIQRQQQQIAGLEGKLQNPAGRAGLGENREVLVVQFGKSSEPLPVSEIAYMFKVGELSCIRTFSGKEYTTTSPLEALEQQLDPQVFFRINRQWLGNRRSIRRFSPDAGGKLILELQPPAPEEVAVSKKRAQDFKTWIGKKV